MALEDHVRRLPLQNKRRDQGIQPLKFFWGNINASSGFNQNGPVLPVCSGCPVISLIQTASAFLAAGIADKRSFVQLRAVVAARGKLLTMGIAVVAESAHFFADRGICTADILLPAVFGKGTFISGFIEMVVLMEGTVLFNLLRDSSRVFS